LENDQKISTFLGLPGASWGFLGASWDLDPVTRARLFNKRHGWQIKGLETAGGVTDAGEFTLVAPHSSCGASKYGNTT